MKIAVIIICAIISIAAAIELFGRIIGNREAAKTAKMPPDALWKKQSEARKRQL